MPAWLSTYRDLRTDGYGRLAALLELVRVWWHGCRGHYDHPGERE